MDYVLKKFIDELVENKSIKEEDRNIYQYALLSTLILGVNIILSLIIGIGLKHPGYCIIFLSALIPLRSNAGGFHASSILVCYFLSFSSLTITLLGINSGFTKNIILMGCIAVISLVLIYYYAPLETENRVLCDYEKNCIRNKAQKIAIVEMILGLVFAFINTAIAYIIWSSLVWCAVGYVAWFIEKIVKKNRAETKTIYKD